ncbi:hypothetical protein L195_g064672, partial [Trifolium pratense]
MSPALPDLAAATLPANPLIGAMIGAATGEATEAAIEAAIGAAKGGEIEGGARDENLVALQARS